MGDLKCPVCSTQFTGPTAKKNLRRHRQRHKGACAGHLAYLRMASVAERKQFYRLLKRGKV